MKEKMILALGLIFQLAIACNVLKRSTRSAVENVQDYQLKAEQNEESNQQRNTDTQVLTYTKDSAWNAYTVKLWPKGRLNYTSGVGFQGEFDSITVRGNRKILSLESSQSTVIDRANEQLKRNQKNEESVKIKDEKVKVDRVPDRTTIAIIIILVFVGVLFVIKTQKR